MKQWSHSTHNTMRRRQRQLIFGHVMASYNARDPQRREAHLLKQLQHLSAWQGSLVHKVLATEFLATLREGRALDKGGRIQRYEEQIRNEQTAQKDRARDEARRRRLTELYDTLRVHEQAASTAKAQRDLMRQGIKQEFLVETLVRAQVVRLVTEEQRNDNVAG